jgi:ABC-2 type transport system permease protein
MKEFSRAVWTIVRREIAAQFNTPMAYIFIVVFLAVSSGLFMFYPGFFDYPVADMSRYFGWALVVLCIFSPAATMRVWAEDRRENTIELLLTFPMPAPALVLGKFLATLAFYLVAVGGTLMIPIMLAWLGEPDWGVVWSGYLGLLLVGAFLISMGMFISGFCRDQVTAFVITFMACVGVTILGWAPLALSVESSLGWFGTFLKNAFGMTLHYVPFTRGIIEFVDVLYFAAWTAIFLFLNGVYLEGRSRPNVGVLFAGTAGLGMLVGVLFNLFIASGSIYRIDMTDGEIYTVSDATVKILKELPVPVQVNFYVTPADKLPPELRDLERDVTDKLSEIRVASGRKLSFKVLHMEAANVVREQGAPDEKEGKDEKEKSLEERLIDKGVRPFPHQSRQADEATTRLIYSAVGVAFKDKEEEIVPRVLPQMIPELEYRIVSIAYKLARKDAPVVALFAPFEEMKIPPHVMRMYQQMGRPVPQQDDPYEYVVKLLEHEKFEVKRVKLEKGDAMPDKFDALVVISPRELDERQKWEINRALVAGKPTLIAAQNYKWNYSINRNQASVSKIEEKPGVNQILEASGIRIDERILMDANHESLTVSSGNPLERMFGGGITLKLPMHIVLNATSMNPDVSITSHIGSLFYLWGSALKVDAEKVKERKLDVVTLVSSSDKAWLVPGTGALTEKSFVQPDKTERYPLAVMVKGQLADAFEGKDRPKWPEAPSEPGMPPPPPSDDNEPPAGPVTRAEGKLIAVGCGQMFNKSFLAGGNMDLFMNSVDALTLGEDLVKIRAKKEVDRIIDKPSAAARGFWKVMVLGFMAAAFITAGVTRLVLVRRARERYRAALRAKA